MQNFAPCTCRRRCRAGTDALTTAVAHNKSSARANMGGLGPSRRAMVAAAKPGVLAAEIESLQWFPKASNWDIVPLAALSKLAGSCTGAPLNMAFCP